MYENEKQLNLSWAAKIKDGCARMTILSAIVSGKINAVKVAGHWVIENDEKFKAWFPDENKRRKKV